MGKWVLIVFSSPCLFWLHFTNLTWQASFGFIVCFCFCFFTLIFRFFVVVVSVSSIDSYEVCLQHTPPFVCSSLRPKLCSKITYLTPTFFLSDITRHLPPFSLSCQCLIISCVVNNLNTILIPMHQTVSKAMCFGTL